MTTRFASACNLISILLLGTFAIILSVLCLDTAVFSAKATASVSPAYLAKLKYQPIQLASK